MYSNPSQEAITILIILLVLEGTLLPSDCMSALVTLPAAQCTEHLEPLDLLGRLAPVLMLQDLKIESLALAGINHPPLKHVVASTSEVQQAALLSFHLGVARVLA